MGALLWLVMGYLQLRAVRRFVGDRGRGRLVDLPDERLRALHGALSNRLVDGAVLGGVAVCLLGAALAAVTGPLLLLLAWAAAAVVLGLAWSARRRTAGEVGRVLDQRDLAPYETPPRRERRQRVVVVVALAGYVVGQVAELVGDRLDEPVLVTIGTAALLVAFLALAVLAWTTVWVAGDEDRAARPT